MQDENSNGIDDELERARAQLEADKDKLKWIIRRRMAVGSFLALLSFGGFYAVVGLFISFDTAKTMAEFNSIVVTIVGALISLLLSYYGTSYLFDKDKLR